MRISQDTDSWKASGILRRDFRHTLGEPEVERHKGKKKSKPGKPRQRINHRHVYVDVTGTPEAPYWSTWTPWYFTRTTKRYRNYLKNRRVLLCAQPGCGKYKVNHYT